MKRRFGGVFEEQYVKAELREKYTADEWLQFQNMLLQNLLRHAFNTVPYYKESFSKAGFDVASLTKINVENIHQLPVLLKDDLRRFGTSTLLSSIREKDGAFF